MNEWLGIGLGGEKRVTNLAPTWFMPVDNFKAIFTLIIFLITQILVIFPVHIPIPRRFFKHNVSNKENSGEIKPTTTTNDKIKIPMDIHTAPVAAVLILLAAGCIHGREVRNGIVGTDGVSPLNVMALFISLAYMTISIDHAGLLRFLAFWVATKTSQSGRKLYISLYIFFFLLGLIVGNDPVILSGVPFLAYFTEKVDIPPTAWIFAQFIVANIASAVLVSSNPTNLVLSGAFSISFFSYTAKLIIPVLAAAILVLPVLLFQFRDAKYIPRRIQQLDINPRSVLTDPFGGMFGAALLILTLCTLVATSVVHPQVYLVTVPPAVIVGVRDVIKDLRNCRTQRNAGIQGGKEKARSPVREGIEKPTRELGNGDSVATNGFPPDGTPPLAPDTEITSIAFPTIEALQPDTSIEGESSMEETSAKPTLLRRLDRIFPTTLSILRTMPFSLVLFSFSMFILVQGLVITGWVDVWAHWWGVWTLRTEVVGAVFGMGLVSCILCNIFGTNIGATILLSRVLQTWLSTSSPSSRLRNASILSLALGSNYGAFTFSFPASLAGLLWRRLLGNKGVKVTMGQFVRLNLLSVAVAMGVSSLVVLGEVYIFDEG